MSDLVLNKDVFLERDVSDTDRHGRLLRYVYIGDMSVNERMVREGYATVHPYRPDVKHCEEYSNAARAAKANDRGLWKIP